MSRRFRSSRKAFRESFGSSSCFLFSTAANYSLHSLFLSSARIPELYGNRVDAWKKRLRCQEVAESRPQRVIVEKRERERQGREKKMKAGHESRLSSPFENESEKANEGLKESGRKKAGVRNDWTFAPCKHNRRPSADWINTRRIRIIEYLRYVPAAPSD